MKKVFIITNGCSNICFETGRYGAFFIENGWSLVKEPAEADLIVMTTCGCLKGKEDQALRQIADLLRTKAPHARLVVGGCMPITSPERLKGVFSGPTFTPRSTELLDQLIAADIKVADIPPAFGRSQRDVADSIVSLCAVRKPPCWTDGPRLLFRGLDRAFRTRDFTTTFDYLTYCEAFNFESDIARIKAAEGCTLKCNFCVVKLARGGLRSRPWRDVLDDFRKALSQGYRRIALIGDELGHYGEDIGTDLVGLLQKLTAEKGDYEIDIEYIEPAALVARFSGLYPIFQTGKIRHFCSPLQSGSDRILRLMNRAEIVADWVAAVKRLNRDIPSLFVSTHLIVGFPGETEEDFRQSMRILEECDFSIVAAVPYEDRPGAPSAGFEGHVPADMRRERCAEMLEHISRKRTTKLARRTWRLLRDHLRK